MKARKPGFEFSLGLSTDNIVAAHPKLKEVLKTENAHADFDWGTDVLEMAAVLVASAAFAQASGGFIFNPQDEKVFTSTEAFQEANNVISKMKDEIDTSPEKY